MPATRPTSSTAQPIATYRILSIDGGGLRGAIPLAILENLERAKPGWLADVNMFAGTSTGALIALALAKGMRPRQVLDVYLKDGPTIFSRNLWREIKELGDAIGPKYDGANREKVCHGILGDDRLDNYLSQDKKRGHVVVCAFDLDDSVESDPAKRRWKAKVFHNLPTTDHSDDGGEIAYRVAMRTSAAPTYFPSYDGFVDGGVFANNPSMCALAQTRDSRLATPIPFDSVRMLSLGTGYVRQFFNGEESWGLAQWAPKLGDLLTDGVNEVAEFQAKHLLGSGNFCRLTIALPAPIPMDDPSKLGVLQRIGDGIDVGPAVQLISRW